MNVFNIIFVFIFIFNKVSQLFKTRKDRKLTVEILLCILVQLYSVVDEDYVMSEEHQIDLENIVGEAFFEDLEYLPDYIINDLIGTHKTNLKNNSLIYIL